MDGNSKPTSFNVPSKVAALMERSGLAKEGCEKEVEEKESQHNSNLLLHAVKEKLSCIPHEEKSALVYVQRIRPELVNDEHILQFLSVENFDIDVSFVTFICVGISYA